METIWCAVCLKKIGGSRSGPAAELAFNLRIIWSTMFVLICMSCRPSESVRVGKGGAISLSKVKADWKYWLSISALSKSEVARWPWGETRGAIPDFELNLPLTKLKNAPKLLAFKIFSSRSLSKLKIASLHSFAIFRYFNLVAGQWVRLNIRQVAALREIKFRIAFGYQRILCLFWCGTNLIGTYNEMIGR